ncbi:solute carrier family 35 member F4-like isoform X2 [Paramacrobiotus metropolitanus]|uniref:solute carrier family 35 member F4-like isoform X2 n=1 Tax=Paramacrobiotus metropolitanus TaxID=2943436 RepID=UPI0024461670|nr:solute carrier family 35 member F4-like isoform X2 [Paramacrobiotus metropolitanus]
MEHRISKYGEELRDAEGFMRLLPDQSDDHPYIFRADPEMQPPEKPEREDEDTVDVIGDDDEFAVVPKTGLSVDPKEDDSAAKDEEAGIASTGNGVVVLQDLIKITSSAGITEEPVHPTEAVRKRGLQGMSDKSKHILGLGLVVVHCITVLSAAQFAKATYSKDFSAPFFIVYFRSAWRIIVFPTFMVLKYIQRAYRNKTDKPTSFMKTFTSCETVFGPKGLTPKAFVYPTGLLAMLWITVQFAHVFAVKFLNNSIVQALFCSETAFCYLLSSLILRAPVYILKVIAVVIALGGVAFMVYSQGKDDLSWEGIAICLIGAVLGSLYMVAFKRFIGKSEDVGKALLLTSTMAAFITVIAWPIVIILYVNGVEYWNWETFPWATVCISSSLTLVCRNRWIQGIVRR